MMKIAKFEKVSFEQFEKDWLKNFPDTNDVKAVYDSIKLPKRATTGSAGYPKARTEPRSLTVIPLRKCAVPDRS